MHKTIYEYANKLIKLNIFKWLKPIISLFY